MAREVGTKVRLEAPLVVWVEAGGGMRGGSGGKAGGGTSGLGGGEAGGGAGGVDGVRMRKEVCE